MKRIVKIKEGGNVPDNAVLIKTDVEKAIDRVEYRNTWIPFVVDKITHTKAVPVFYQAVEVAKR